MHKGGYVSKESIEEINDMLKEKSSWWLVNGKLVHCTSYELKFYKEIIEQNKV